MNLNVFFNLEFSTTSIINKLVYIFVKGPAEGSLRVLEFFTALKTHLWPLAVVCSMVGLLSFWHIPHFHSQFYLIWLTSCTSSIKAKLFNISYKILTQRWDKLWWSRLNSWWDWWHIKQTTCLSNFFLTRVFWRKKTKFYTKLVSFILYLY